MKIMQWVCLVVLLSGVVVLRAQTVDSLNPLPQVAPTTVALQADSRLTVTPLNEEIALSSVRFVALPDIHDRCIVAAAAKLIETVPGALLVTRDRAIRASAFVPTLWD